MSNLRAYCSSCGAANGYTLEKPKFCQSCGQSFGGLRPVPKKKAVKPQQVIEQQEEEEEESFDVQVDSLAFETQNYAPRKVTLGQIVDSVDPNTQPPAQRSVDASDVQRRSDEEVLSELKREGGSLRSSPEK